MRNLRSRQRGFEFYQVDFVSLNLVLVYKSLFSLTFNNSGKFRDPTSWNYLEKLHLIIRLQEDFQSVFFYLF